MRYNHIAPVLDVDATSWRKRTDLYGAILPVLGAPQWHGANMNALVESIIWGEINAINPPFKLRIRGTANLPADVAEELSWLKEGVDDGREEFETRQGHTIDVDIELLP